MNRADLTNLTSISIEIAVGIAIGLLIFTLDRKSSKKQEEIISKIGKYTENQEKGLRLNKIVILSRINLKLVMIQTDYKRALDKISFDNLSSEEQLLRKNAVLNNDKNKQLVFEIFEDALKIAHQPESKLDGAIMAFAGFFRLFLYPKDSEAELYLNQVTNLSADYILQFAKALSSKIEEYINELTGRTK
jgi:hypothetical protein